MSNDSVLSSLFYFATHTLVHTSLHRYGHYAEGTGSVLKMADIDVRFRWLLIKRYRYHIYKGNFAVLLTPF